MATQAYMSRNSDGKKVDVTKLAQRQAPGHPAELQPRDGAENRTPAPTREPTSTADLARSTSWGRSSGDMGDNPGKAGYGGASSLNPSEKAGDPVFSPLGPAGADPVLRNLAMGTARAIDANDDWQTRQVDKTPYPARHGMKHRTGDGAIPKTTQPASGDEASRRNAALKRTEG